MKKYVLHPGIVTDDAEQKSYFISASTLAYLHGVDVSQCQVADPTRVCSAGPIKNLDIHLHPQWHDAEDCGLRVIAVVS